MRCDVDNDDDDAICYEYTQFFLKPTPRNQLYNQIHFRALSNLKKSITRKQR